MGPARRLLTAAYMLCQTDGPSGVCEKSGHRWKEDLRKEWAVPGHKPATLAVSNDRRLCLKTFEFPR
jgi:hypothetical protein